MRIVIHERDGVMNGEMGTCLKRELNFFHVARFTCHVATARLAEWVDLAVLPGGAHLGSCRWAVCTRHIGNALHVSKGFLSLS